MVLASIAQQLNCCRQFSHPPVDGDFDPKRSACRMDASSYLIPVLHNPHFVEQRFCRPLAWATAQGSNVTLPYPPDCHKLRFVYSLSGRGRVILGCADIA
jgi:hypothetical protein